MPPSVGANFWWWFQTMLCPPRKIGGRFPQFERLHSFSDGLKPTNHQPTKRFENNAKVTNTRLLIYYQQPEETGSIFGGAAECRPSKRKVGGVEIHPGKQKIKKVGRIQGGPQIQL